MLKTLSIKLSKIILVSYSLLLGFAWGFSDALIFLPPEPGYKITDSHIAITSKSAENNLSHTIIAKYLKNPSARYTILYSHGNAVDLSGLSSLQTKFLRHNYSIIMYDYSGYGQSEGTPSEQQVYHDAQAVYDYLTNDAGLKTDEIIIYGHSLGAAVATELALNNPAAALIMESPFTTAFRVKTHFAIVPFDKFASIEKLPEIQTPVLIMHSLDDTIIPPSHSQVLFDSANEPKQLIWFKRAGHTQITHQKQAFWKPFHTFLYTL